MVRLLSELRQRGADLRGVSLMARRGLARGPAVSRLQHARAALLRELVLQLRAVIDDAARQPARGRADGQRERGRAGGGQQPLEPDHPSLHSPSA